MPAVLGKGPRAQNRSKQKDLGKIMVVLFFLCVVLSLLVFSVNSYCCLLFGVSLICIDFVLLLVCFPGFLYFSLCFSYVMLCSCLLLLVLCVVLPSLVFLFLVLIRLGQTVIHLLALAGF